MIVPRPGEAAIDQRQAEVDREVADQVGRGRADQQAADPLADEHVGARGRGAGAASAGAPGRSPRRPAPRRDGARRGAVAVGGDLLVALRRSGGAAQQRVVGLARFVEAGHRRLEDGDRAARRRRGVRAIAAATTVLPTSVPVPVTKTPFTAAQAASWRPRGRSAPMPSSRAALADELARRARSSSAAMGRHHREAQARGALGHRRRADALGEDAALQEPLAELHRRARRRRPATGTIWVSRAARPRGPRAASASRRIAGVGAQPLDPPGLRLRAAPAPPGRRRRPGGGGAVEKMNGAGGVEQVVDRLRGRRRRRRRRSRAPCRACRHHVDLAAEPGRGDRAAAARAERAGARAPRRPSGGSRGAGRARASSASGATSPSIEKTPSVTISEPRPPASRRPQARCSRSPWR